MMSLLCALWTVSVWGLVFGAAFAVLRYLWELVGVSGASEKAVFISGCDTGFGRLLALRLATRGCTVFAGCLTGKGEEELVKASAGLAGKVTPVACDVTSEASVASAAAAVRKALGPSGSLWAVVNNAGIVGTSGYDDFTTPDDYKHAMEVNTIGVIRTTHAFKALVKRSKGRIVTVASIMGRVPQAGCGPYCVSKYAVEGYCDVLRHEMALFGVKVCILEPGFFATNLTDVGATQRMFRKIWDRASQETRDEYGQEFFQQTEAKIPEMMSAFASPRTEWVVDAYEHALLAAFPRHRYHVGWDSIFYFTPMGVAPSWVYDYLAEKSQRYFGMPKPRAAV